MVGMGADEVFRLVAHHGGIDTKFQVLEIFSPPIFKLRVEFFQKSQRELLVADCGGKVLPKEKLGKGEQLQWLRL